MIYTSILKNSYQDSVNLMLLTSDLATMEGIDKISVMMGTGANKEIMKNAQLYVEELDEAGANDICIVFASERTDCMPLVQEKIEEFLKNQDQKKHKTHMEIARTWESALKKQKEANIAIISIPGEYAAKEAKRSLENGLHTFIFSDNVSLEDEKQLKEMAFQKGLLFMGPDCGTGIIAGVPLAFANNLDAGNISVIGASGTGIQEVTTLISRKGGGIRQAIGIGGRDLQEKIGGLSALSAISMLSNDELSDVVVFISKPPAASVKRKIIDALSSIGKDVVCIFLGDEKEKNHNNVYYAETLEEAASLALSLSQLSYDKKAVETIANQKTQRNIIGLYSGGTLAYEASFLLKKEFPIENASPEENGVMLKTDNMLILDLGDDFYTKGKPHPMIDPANRIQFLKDAIKDKETAIIILDFVLGYGGNENMCRIFADCIIEEKKALQKEKREIIFLASLVGTNQDPSSYSSQRSILEAAGIIVSSSNAETIFYCVNLYHKIENFRLLQKTYESAFLLQKQNIQNEVIAINVGLPQFTESITNNQAQVVQYQWQPAAGGNKELEAILDGLKNR